jgi:DNA-binding IclR family transcriptional regulator
LPYLRDLADAVSATTALTVRDGDEAVVLAVVPPRTSDVHIAYRTGLRHRLDQAASGLALLAAEGERAGERAAVAEARARGWALSRGELLGGVEGVGAPIVLPGGECVGAVSAVWIDDRDPAPVAEALVRCAGAVAAALR